MTVRIRINDTLPDEAIHIRKDVFMDEQGFNNEFDAVDQTAHHLVLYEGEQEIGTIRIYPNENGTWSIGRLAILKPYRGKGYSRTLVKAGEEAIQAFGGKKIVIHAQKRLQPMYESYGYRSAGIEDDDEGVPHVWMSKTL